MHICAAPSKGFWSSPLKLLGLISHVCDMACSVAGLIFVPAELGDRLCAISYALVAIHNKDGITKNR